jgi:hypothetical protein
VIFYENNKGYNKAVSLSHGRDSVVGIATRYGLDDLAIKSSWGEVLLTAPGPYPSSCKMGTGSISRGQSGRGMALTTRPHLAPRLKKE